MTASAPSAHDLRPVGSLLAVIGVLSLGLTGVVGVSDGYMTPLEWAIAAMVLLPAMLVGLVISLRRPQLVIGPLVVALGASPAVTFALEAWAESIETDVRPGGQVAAWIAAGSWVWYYVWPALIALYFPDGRLPDPRWLPVATGLVVLPAAMQIVFTFDPTTYGEDGMPGGPPAVSSIELLPAVGGALMVGFLGLLIAAVASLFGRYRRGDPVTRLQIRWLAAGAAAFPLTLVTGWIVMLILPGRWYSFLLLGLAVGAVTMPASIAVAVLRHGLWDLGRLVSRTTSYLTVTLALVTSYAVLVTSMSWLLPGSPAVVAVATLVVAAAFRPLLKRVQQQVDRRFNRERFDGNRSVEEFGARLRDQTDVDHVVDDLLDVVSRTLQPATIVVWRSP